MTDVSTRNFGYLIAYLIPGLAALTSLGQWWPDAPPLSALHQVSVGGFLFATLAAVAVGMTIDVARWLTLDRLHHRTGVQLATWDFSLFSRKRNAVMTLTEQHFRYYQYYGNMLLVDVLHAMAWADDLWSAVFFLVLGMLFFTASRDALTKYYQRTGQLMSDY